jgi:hypothetical protein
VAPSQPSTPSRENHQHTNHRQSSNISRRHFSSRVHTPTSTNELFPDSGHTALTNVPRCTSHGVLTTSNIGSTCVEQARNIFRRQIIIAASESRRLATGRVRPASLATFSSGLRQATSNIRICIESNERRPSPRNSAGLFQPAVFCLYCTVSPDLPLFHESHVRSPSACAGASRQGRCIAVSASSSSIYLSLNAKAGKRLSSFLP